MNTYAIDFESYYDATIGFETHGNCGYVEHPDFNAYMVSVSGSDGFRWTGHPSKLNWSMFDGQRCLAHNASFDEAVYNRHFHTGIGPAEWCCTADLAAFSGYPRSLAGVMQQKYGKTRDKSIRDKMKGINPEVSANDPVNLAYAQEDADDCLRIWMDLSAQWPLIERRLSYLTRWMGWCGMDVDQSYVAECRAKLGAQITEIETAIPWATTAKLASPIAIAEYLTGLGIPVPKSRAKTSEDFARWLEEYADKAPVVKQISSLSSLRRTYSTFTILASRTREDGSFPYSKLYCGAHTKRWSGAGGFNMENQNREDSFGTNLRRAFIPRSGMKFIIVDLANIEPRIAAARTGEKELLEMCRTMSPYAAWGILTNRIGDLKAFDKARKVPGSDEFKLYACLKEESLSLIYGVGHVKHQGSLRRFGMDIDLGEAKRRVDNFRAARPLLRQCWREKENAFRRALGTDLYAPQMPSGNRLHYWDPRQEQVEEKGELRVQMVADTIKGGDRKKRGDATKKIYGAYLFQNEIQSIARDVFAERTLAVCDALPDTRLCMTAHDEDVFECPANVAEDRVRDVRHLLTIPPDWMPGVPLDVSIEIADYYKK